MDRSSKWLGNAVLQFLSGSELPIICGIQAGAGQTLAWDVVEGFRNPREAGPGDLPDWMVSEPRVLLHGVLCVCDTLSTGA